MLSNNIQSRLDRKDYSVEVVKFGSATQLFKKVWRFLTREQAVEKLRYWVANVLVLKVTVRHIKRQDDKVTSEEAVFEGKMIFTKEHQTFWDERPPLTATELKGWLPIYADKYVTESITSTPNHKTIDKLVAYYEMWHLTNPLEIARLIRHRYPRWRLGAIYKIITGENLTNPDD